MNFHSTDTASLCPHASASGLMSALRPRTVAPEHRPADYVKFEQYEDAGDSDRELLYAWRAGERRAGDQLLRRHLDALRRYIHARMAGEVGDLIQQTLVACVEARDRLPDQVAFRAYMLGIARNILLQHHRRAEVRRRVGPLLRASTLTSDPAPTHDALDCERKQRVVEELDNLPRHLQVTTRMYYWQELKISEISDQLGLPPGTVKSRMHAAKRLLRARLQSTAEPQAAY